jgi:RNA polymerase sigma factor (sigma-70 family)
MATHPVLDFLRRLKPADPARQTPDAELLARFVVSRNEAAIAELVQRHGPLVWRLCVRVLGEAADAEDAFQAAFLVLARRAASVSRPELLANWLYGVAYRTALKVRDERRRRQIPLQEERAVNNTTPLDEASRRELRERLDSELSQLPDRYRVPIVLHFLEGHTQEEVARMLGCPRPTIATRLTRACERLRTRLLHRGLTLSTGALGAALAEEASAALPLTLLEATVHAAPLFAAGGSILAPQAAAAVAEGVLQTMFLIKIKFAFAGVLLVAVVAAGVSVLASQGLTPDHPGQPEAFAPKAGARDDVVEKELEKLQGTWVLTAVEWDGKAPAPQDVTSDARREWSIRGNKFTDGQVGDQFKKSTGFLRIDARQTPRTMDLSPTEAFQPAETAYSIYDVQGDTLKVAQWGRVIVPGQADKKPDRESKPGERPREFKTNLDSGVIITFWKKKPSRAEESKSAVVLPVWGKPADGLRIGIAAVERSPADHGKVRLSIALENVGQKDLMLNLGIMLANGARQYPLAVRLIVTDSADTRRIFHLHMPEPGVAGRVDPFIVPLPVGCRYTLSCLLENFIEEGGWAFPLRNAGNYQISAEFMGKGVERTNTDTGGLALMHYWTGTVTSPGVPITLP